MIPATCMSTTMDRNQAFAARIFPFDLIPILLLSDGLLNNVMVRVGMVFILYHTKLYQIIQCDDTW